MKGRSARAKGHGFERDVAEQFRRVYPQAKRGLGQARASGEVPDVQGTPYWIEVKRGNSTSPRAAWKQANRDRLAKGDGRPPLVVYRDDRAEAVVMLEFSRYIALLIAAEHRFPEPAPPADPYPDGKL